MPYKSIDTIVDENKPLNFPAEFLNSLDTSGTPPHNLPLKIGSLIILLRNLILPRTYNSTLLVIKRITGKLLEENILTIKFKGEIVLSARIPQKSSESPIPFERLQFLIRLVFEMTINKSQRQTTSI
ncbi:ATP-dependent DNA helicase [Trichonephila clavipes]|nr:ATP-dependent DNA helicase [Trichonephila clavipes]